MFFPRLFARDLELMEEDLVSALVGRLVVGQCIGTLGGQVNHSQRELCPSNL
jgi:hypothetical protein